MHYHIELIPHGTAFGQPVGGTGGTEVLTESHLSETNGSYWVRTWIVRLTDRKANYAISPAPIYCGEEEMYYSTKRPTKKWNALYVEWKS